MSKVLSIRGACLHIEMQNGEAQDEAVDRLLDILDENGIHLSLWAEEEVEDE